MKETPQHSLDPKIKMVWRLSQAVVITLVSLCVFACGAIPWIVSADTHFWATPFCIGVLAVYVVWMLLALVVYTPLRYRFWRYELTPEYLDLSFGVIWRRRIIVPFIRVQNTDTEQGPVLRAFGLASVTVSTAADSMHIPGLDAEAAAQLRDKAAEFARLAREDV